MISRSLALAFAGLISGTCPDRTGRRTDHSTHVSPGKVPPRAAGGASEADTPGQRVAQHDPVTHEAVQRVLEGRRTVLLEEEVAYPGKPEPATGSTSSSQKLALMRAQASFVRTSR